MKPFSNLGEAGWKRVTHKLPQSRRPPGVPNVTSLVLSRDSRARIEADSLKTIVIFCSVGLFVSLLFVACGIDVNPGSF